MVHEFPHSIVLSFDLLSSSASSKNIEPSSAALEVHALEITTWIEENCNGEWTWDIYRGDNPGFKYSFEDLKDATLFRLRF